MAEIYVPFSWFEPMWLENLGFAAPGDGWRLTAAGETALGGKLPVNPSGGVLSSNPIGASGLLRFAEAAMQVMGKAGAHQVAGARTALGHAYGGGSQYFSMWVVSSEFLAGGVRLAENHQVRRVAEHGLRGEPGGWIFRTAPGLRLALLPPHTRSIKKTNGGARRKKRADSEDSFTFPYMSVNVGSG